MTYNPNLGTFLERDPIEAGENLYQYVHSNPVIRLDPFGLEGANPPTSGQALPTTAPMVFRIGVLGPPSFEIEDIPTMTLSEVDDLWRSYFAARNVPSTNDDPSQPLYQLRPDPKLILDAIEHRQADLRNWEQELQGSRATMEQAKDAAVKALNELNWEEAPVVMKTTGLSTLLQKLDKMMYTYPGRLGDIPGAEGTLASAFRPKERRFRWKNTISWEDAFHEGIHAWDNANRWYTDRGKAGDGWDDSAERLAYASKELVETVKGLAQWEARLRATLHNCSSPSFTDEITRLRQIWNEKWEFVGKTCPEWTWTGNASDAAKPFDLDRDLGDVNAKLKFRLSCSILRAALEKEYGLEPGFLTCPPSLPLMLR
jgi:hypothetical protein